MIKGYFLLDERTSELQSFFDENPEVGEEFQRRYLMSWLHHENALDGLVLSEEEIVLALEHHVVADPSTMTVIAAVRSHFRAFEHLRLAARPKRAQITIPLLRSLYDQLIEGSHTTEKERAVLRGEMPLHRIYFHEIMEPQEIEAALETWAKMLITAEFKEQHPVRQAAGAHWHFMQIFPFAQHNGRIGRLIQAFFLIRAGYFPPIIHATERQAYYESLRRSSSALRSLLIRSMETSLDSSCRYVRSVGQRRASSS